MELFQNLIRKPKITYQLPDNSKYLKLDYDGQHVSIIPFDIWRIIFQYITDFNDIFHFLITHRRAAAILRESIGKVVHRGKNVPLEPSLVFLASCLRLQQLKFVSNNNWPAHIIDHLITLAKMKTLHNIKINVRAAPVNNSDKHKYREVAEAWVEAGKASTGRFVLPCFAMKYGFTSCAPFDLITDKIPIMRRFFYQDSSHPLTWQHMEELMVMISHAKPIGLEWGGLLPGLTDVMEGTEHRLKYIGSSTAIFGQNLTEFMHSLIETKRPHPLEVINILTPTELIDPLISKYRDTLKAILIPGSDSGLISVEQLKLRYPNIRFFQRRHAEHDSRNNNLRYQDAV